MLPKFLKEFSGAESGAVTIEFIILVAMVTTLGVASSRSVFDGLASTGNIAVRHLERATPVTLGCLGDAGDAACQD